MDISKSDSHNVQLDQFYRSAIDGSETAGEFLISRLDELEDSQLISLIVCTDGEAIQIASWEELKTRYDQLPTRYLEDILLEFKNIKVYHL
jgi:hypothetical protein